MSVNGVATATVQATPIVAPPQTAAICFIKKYNHVAQSRGAQHGDPKKTASKVTVLKSQQAEGVIDGGIAKVFAASTTSIAPSTLQKHQAGASRWLCLCIEVLALHDLFVQLLPQVRLGLHDIIRSQGRHFVLDTTQHKQFGTRHWSIQSMYAPVIKRGFNGSILPHGNCQ